MNYYRFSTADGERPGSFVFTFFEVDDGGAPVRQLDVHTGSLFGRARRSSRDDPRLGRAGHAQEMRTEAFDLSEIEDNRITVGEFELAWSTGQHKVRDYNEFKWYVLALADERGTNYLQELMFVADDWYPTRTLSERLAFCERAVRELLLEGLVAISTSDWHDRTESLVPPERYDEVLLSRRTWFYVPVQKPGTTEEEVGGPFVDLDITEKGRAVFEQKLRLGPQHWRID